MMQVLPLIEVSTQIEKEKGCITDDDGTHPNLEMPANMQQNMNLYDFSI